MIRAVATALLLSSACSLSAFDDRRARAWSDSRDPPASIPFSDYATSLTTVDRERAGSTVIVAGLPPGLVTMSYDDHGALTQRGLVIDDATFDANTRIVGALDPIPGANGLFAVGGLLSPNEIRLFDANTGVDGPMQRKTISTACGAGVTFGPAMVFGLTNAPSLEVLDLVALAGDQLLLFPDPNLELPEPECFRCRLTHPAQAITRAMDVVVADLDQALSGEEVVVSVELASGVGTLLVYDAVSLLAGDGADCPASRYVETNIPAGREPDFGRRIAVGDVDRDPGAEVALTAPSSHSLYVLRNADLMTLPDPLSPIQILEPTDSMSFPGSVVFGDFDGDQEDDEEIAVADPDAHPAGLDQAGQVTLYKLLDPQGPIFFEAITTLYDPHGYAGQRFGRSLEVVEFFLSAGAAADLLVVGARGEVFTYFQLVQGGNDPRRR